MKEYQTNDSWLLSVCQKSTLIIAEIASISEYLENAYNLIDYYAFSTRGNPALIHGLKTAVSAQRISDT